MYRGRVGKNGPLFTNIKKSTLFGIKKQKFKLIEYKMKHFLMSLNNIEAEYPETIL